MKFKSNHSLRLYELLKKECYTSKAKQKGYDRWSDFRRRCLLPAIEELNGIGEFVLTYSVGKSGQGGKVNSITFFVEYNNTNIEEMPVMPKKLTEDEKNDIYDQISKLREELNIIWRSIRSLTTGHITTGH